MAFELHNSCGGMITMKIFKTLIPIFMFILLASPVMLLKGCGSSAGDGCPSGSYWASSTDTITGQADDSFTTFDNFGGGFFYYTPLLYTVRDASGIPKNNICIEFYTDGFYYPDASYDANPPVPVTGPLSRITRVTDDHGTIQLYWTTEVLPASDPAGAVSGDSWVEAYSGTLQDKFTVSWTVPAIPPPLQITTTALPGGQFGVAYTGTLTATGGTTPYVWAVTAFTLPAGLILDGNTGVISGTPTTVGGETRTFNVTVSDVAGDAVTSSFTIVIAP